MEQKVKTTSGQELHVGKPTYFQIMNEIYISL